MGRLLRLPRLRRDRAAGDVEQTELSPTAYKTLSRNIPTALTAIGGALALLGGVGAWARATELAPGGLTAEEVRVLMGHTDPEGIAIAILGGVAFVGSVAWLGHRLVLKLVPALASLALIGLIVRELPAVNELARTWVAEASEGTLEFESFHSGFGWGAWLLIFSAVALVVAVMAGILREVDLRRGMPE